MKPWAIHIFYIVTITMMGFGLATATVRINSLERVIGHTLALLKLSNDTARARDNMYLPATREAKR